jgi:integrating conjugative element protein (TIGR03759 family)
MRLICLLSSLLLLTVAHATPVHNLRLNSPALHRQKPPGLSQPQWQHYQQLMQGSPGRWYPKLDPEEVMGIMAKTPQERAYWARVVVEQQKKRLTRELAFSRAVSQAWHRGYPDLKPVASFDVKPYAPQHQHAPKVCHKP